MEGGDASPATIKVIGVGGGGANAVNRMIAAGVRGVEYIACNTDLQALRLAGTEETADRRAADQGAGRRRRSRGRAQRGARGSGENSTRSSRAPTWSFSPPEWGAGRARGPGPIIAKLAAEAGALTVAVVTKPFDFEGRKRMRQAERSARDLRDHVDTLITIPNQRLLSFVERNTPLNDAFKTADDVLRQAIQGISDLINCPGEINLDFADVKKIMSDMGRALMGTATAEGENRAVHAAQAAISSPLLEDASIEGARGVLMNITGGADLTLFEVNEAAEIIQQAADPEAEILFGCVHDERLSGIVKVTVIATGFDRAEDMEMPAEEERRPAAAVRPGRAPFLRVDDSGGFGPNASSRDDFDIPTVLRRQMD